MDRSDTLPRVDRKKNFFLAFVGILAIGIVAAPGSVAQAQAPFCFFPGNIATFGCTITNLSTGVTQVGVECIGTDDPEEITGIDQQAPTKEVIFGMGGNDIIRGGDGPDFICAGDGEDEVYGEDSHDRLDGGEGDDMLFGGPGKDRLFGRNGNDILEGGEGNDILSGGANNAA